MHATHALAALAALVPLASAHWRMTNITANGQVYQAANPYTTRPRASVNWRAENGNFGFVNITSSIDIACHIGATPATQSIPVEAGATLTAGWGIGYNHPEGVYMNYMARCPGNCSEADLNTLSFFKISEEGLIPNPNATSKNLYWSTGRLGADGGMRDITLPNNLQAGNYILRTEIIALHFARNPNGAQFYPTCVNLQVSGSGNANPAGVPATQIYKADEPGVLVNVYYPRPTNYKPPGPALPAELTFGNAPPPSQPSSAPAPPPSSAPTPPPSSAPAPPPSTTPAPPPSPTPAPPPPSSNPEPAPAPSTTPVPEPAPAPTTIEAPAPPATTSETTTTVVVPATPSSYPSPTPEPAPQPEPAPAPGPAPADPKPKNPLLDASVDQILAWLQELLASGKLNI